MRMLVLGGTGFLSREIAAEALRRGHEVVGAARGVSGTAPGGVDFVRWDRAKPVPERLANTSFDAVVDVSRMHGQVHRAVEAFPDAHWTFVSTCNVYADTAVPGAGGELAPAYVSSPELLERGVGEWMGPGSVPLWIGSPGFEGFMARDVTASLQAGLAPRPIHETVRDTLTWLEARPEASVTGLTRADERALLTSLRG